MALDRATTAGGATPAAERAFQASTSTDRN
jgi:hypothetical protein